MEWDHVARRVLPRQRVYAFVARGVRNAEFHEYNRARRGTAGQSAFGCRTRPHKVNPARGSAVVSIAVGTAVLRIGKGSDDSPTLLLPFTVTILGALPHEKETVSYTH